MNNTDTPDIARHKGEKVARQKKKMFHDRLCLQALAYIARAVFHCSALAPTLLLPLCILLGASPYADFLILVKLPTCKDVSSRLVA